MTHAAFIESNIDKEVLQSFKNVDVNCEWSGSENLGPLFYFWKKSCLENLEVQDTGTESVNNVNESFREAVSVCYKRIT